MTSFATLEFKKHPNYTDKGAIQAQLFFSNGYGASVIRGRRSYGGREELYELAVLKGNEDKSSLCYTTPITSDVRGYLSEEDVTKLLQEVEALPKHD